MNTKLVHLALYIAEKSKDDSRFSSTKLNKLLFLIDFHAFGKWGKSVTGSKYIHNEQGPTIQNWNIIRDEIVSEGLAKIEQRPVFIYVQNRLVPLIEPDETLFSVQELEFVTSTIEYYWYKNAKDLSDWTHTMTPWLSTGQGEVIPYESVFMLEPGTITDEDRQWAKKALEEMTEDDMQPVDWYD